METNRHLNLESEIHGRNKETGYREIWHSQDILKAGDRETESPVPIECV